MKLHSHNYLPVCQVESGISSLFCVENTVSKMYILCIELHVDMLTMVHTGFGQFIAVWTRAESSSTHSVILQDRKCTNRINVKIASICKVPPFDVHITNAAYNVHPFKHREQLEDLNKCELWLA